MVELKPAFTPSLPAGAKWCQPGDMQDQRYYLVRFEDPDCRDSIFTDWEKAKDFYTSATLSWSCWLFAAVPADEVRGDAPTVSDLQRQLSEAVERAEMAERQGEDQWAGWVKADCRARAAEAEVARLRGALRIIAGIDPCIDNLMGNVDLARAALQGEPSVPLNEQALVEALDALRGEPKP